MSELVHHCSELTVTSIQGVIGVNWGGPREGGREGVSGWVGGWVSE